MNIRICVFCSTSNSFIEQIRKVLQSNNIEIVNIKQERDFRRYLEDLADRLLTVSARFRDLSGVVSVMLVSGASEQSQISQEDEFFSPALRIFRFHRSIEKSQPDARKFALELVGRFVAWERSRFHRLVRPSAGSVALLPLRNAGSDLLRKSIYEMANFQRDELDSRVFREITPAKRDSGIKVRHLVFKGIVNPPGHPVRRCTCTVHCDVHAAFRLGHPVPDSFEFDITTARAISVSRFYLCDGSESRVPVKASHLNMRINDDFKPGYK